jgi:predicted NBD/HSP70 family sugar kinase
LGEMQLGLGQRYNSFFYVLISAGLGGGFVLDGNYVRGANGRSGELGFMRASLEAGKQEQVQKLVSLSGLTEFLAGRGFSVAALRDDAPPHDFLRCLNDWIEQAASRLCTPLDAINCLINPSMVLIGGRLPRQVVERLAGRLNAIIGDATDAPSIAKVERAALSEDAPAVGAAILPFSHFLLPKPGALWKASGSDAGFVVEA